MKTPVLDSAKVGRPDQKGFYRRRVLRIYPLYVSGVLASLLPFCFTGGTAISTYNAHFELASVGTVIGNLFFLQEFFVRSLPANGPLRTLAVEVFCYLLAPLFFRMPSWVLMGIVAISGTAFALHPYLHLGFFGSLSYGLPALFLIWAWLGGCLFHRLGNADLIHRPSIYCRRRDGNYPNCVA